MAWRPILYVIVTAYPLRTPPRGRLILIR